MGISLCLIPELMISREVARELYTRPRARNNFGNRGCIGESGFEHMHVCIIMDGVYIYHAHTIFPLPLFFVGTYERIKGVFRENRPLLG